MTSYINNINYSKNMSSNNRLIVIDNFYEDPLSIRNFALQQSFEKHNYHPGYRTDSFVDLKLKGIIQSVLPQNLGRIVKFGGNGNCTFQYNVSSDISWIHSDSAHNWAGVVFLTPSAPVSAGTSFYKFYDGSHTSINGKNNIGEVMNNRMDYDKWELVSKIGNVFNRLILYDSKQYHISSEYFGDNINNCRLIQLFFFTTLY